MQTSRVRSGAFGQQPPGRDHRVQERQGHGGAGGAAEEGAAGQLLSGDERHRDLLIEGASTTR